MSRQAGAVQLDPLGGRDDFVAPFQLEESPVRGRIARLGATAQDVLAAHDYPTPVGALLGQALTLTLLVGASLKFEGRLIVQTRGDGPVSLMVTEYTTDGALRGYAHLDESRAGDLTSAESAPNAGALLGEGQLAMTIDRGPEFDRYQSLAPIEGADLSEIAEGYFEQSEQVPTRISLAAGRGEDGVWRAGGAILQRIAGDDARGHAADAWDEGRALFDTLQADELIDPYLSSGALLFRLFHEGGVRVFPPMSVRKGCACTEEKVLGLLARLPQSELKDLAEADGRVSVRCEYCNREYRFAPSDVADA